MIKASKMRMSYSGNTLAFQAKARGSIPLIRSLRCAGKEATFPLLPMLRTHAYTHFALILR
jgi:hypothetical protein